jgi:hypothetical protein
LVGGDGTDVLFGNAGNDIFAWERDHFGDADRIMDWNDGDRIDVRGAGGGFRAVQDGLNVRLFHDADDNGAPDQLVVTVIGVTAGQISGAILA